jgi:hypothetical protein
MRGDVIRTLAALGAVCFGAAGADTLKLVSANSSDAITLNGRLDEDIWKGAGVVRRAQQSPYPGRATPYETEVRVILAGDRLYFGFICRDPEVRKIAVHSMQRDDPCPFVERCVVTAHTTSSPAKLTLVGSCFNVVFPCNNRRVDSSHVS